MALLDVFIGVPQSKYAGLAIVVALLSVAVAMLMGKDSVPMGQKFIAILMMFLVALPGLLLSLFQLTCLVTGSGKGTGNKTWWCGAYAWIGTILSFLYALVIVAVAILAITRGTDIQGELSAMNVEMFEDAKKAAEKAAAEYFAEANAVEEPKSADMPPMEGEMPPPAPESAPAAIPMMPPAGDVMIPEVPDVPSAAEPEMFSSCGAPIGGAY